MTQGSHDPWRLPALERLGAQFRDLENADQPVRPIESRSRWRPILVCGGGLAAVFVSALVLLDTGRPAAALSAINHASAAAAESRTVRFHSAITIVIAGHDFRGFTERGQIDFLTGAYTTTLNLGPAGGVLERRNVAGVLYIAQLRGRRSASRVRWLAIRLAGSHGATGSSALERDPITDPPLLLRALAGIRSAVIVAGRQELAGVPTTRYHLVTDLGSFLRATSRSAGDRKYRTVTVALTVWLDDQGRPRRVDETFAGVSYLGPASITNDVIFSNYGGRVIVPAPPKRFLSPRIRISPPSPFGPNPLRLFDR
jgi:hypothetical protein